MLFETMSEPPKENKEEQGKNLTKDGYYNIDKRITLYRGLGLPEKAI